jgi:hypothetical protein
LSPPSAIPSLAASCAAVIGPRMAGADGVENCLLALAHSVVRTVDHARAVLTGLAWISGGRDRPVVIGDLG